MSRVLGIEELRISSALLEPNEFVSVPYQAETTVLEVKKSQQLKDFLTNHAPFYYYDIIEENIELFMDDSSHSCTFENEKKISDYPIQADSEILVRIARSKKSYDKYIYVDLGNNTQSKVGYHPTRTIESIQRDPCLQRLRPSLVSSVKIPKRLTFNNQELEPNKTLEDCGIQHGDILQAHYNTTGNHATSYIIPFLLIGSMIVISIFAYKSSKKQKVPRDRN